MGKTLITGITGNVGSEVARALLNRGADLRGAVLESEMEKAKKLFGDDVELTHFDFSTPETWKRAYEGADRVFLMRPPAIADVQNNINPSLDFARKAGVEHVVFLSLLGVAKNPIVPHYKVEKHILTQQIPYTFLRPSFFMQNLSGFFRDFVNQEDILFCPAGRGKTSFVDVRDIAAVGALALTDEAHLNKAYDLTGSEALDYYQVAEMLTRELGRTITYTNPGLLQFRHRLRELKMDPGYTTVLTGIFLTAKMGMAKLVTQDTERLLGRSPLSMQKFVSDYRHLWLKP